MDDNLIFSNIKEQEVISDIDVVKAYSILYHALVLNENDVYLFLSCINLLSTYAKQNKKKISYSFKSRIFFLNELLAYNDFKNIKVSYFYTKSQSLYMVMVNDVQFSFHNVIIEKGAWDLLKKYQAQLSWDGIRKQMCAKTVFDVALSKDNLTKQTRDYEDLIEFLDKKVEDFNNGLIKIDKKGLVNQSGDFV
jgi:hypothetical protein